MFFLPGFEPLLIHTNVSQTSVSENVCSRAQAFKLFNQTALFLYNQQPKYPHFAYLYFLFKCSSLKSAQLVWLVFDVSWSAIKSEILRVACPQKKNVLVGLVNESPLVLSPDHILGTYFLNRHQINCICSIWYPNSIQWNLFLAVSWL